MKNKIDIQIYETASGKRPYDKWESKLSRRTRAIISARLVRMRIGIFGDCKSIKGIKDLYEVRIHIESGYRIYFGKYKEKIVLLLCGGDKGSQKRDIQKSYRYWQDYLEAQKR